MGIATTLSYDRRASASLFSRLRTAGGQADPFPIYAELLSRGEVSPAPWGGSVVTGFAACDHVLRSRDWLEPDKRWRERHGSGTRWNASSSREMSNTLVALNPPDHMRVRRAAGTFDRASMEQVSRRVSRTTDQLLDSLSEQLHHGEVDFAALVAEELPVATIGDWLGLPTADWPRLRQLTHDQVFTQELLPSASQLAASDAATAELREYFMDLVTHRRSHPGEDPVSRWIQTWDSMEPDRDRADEAVYFLVLFVLLAALETTSTLLATMTLLLVESPERWDHIADHPELVPDFVEETLRYDPPTHVISRVAAQDCVLGDIEIRRTRWSTSWWERHIGTPQDTGTPKDSTRCASRAPHLAFSGGIHYCLGAPLARLEAQTLLRHLTRRLPRLTLVRRPSMAPRLAFRRLLNLMSPSLDPHPRA